MSYAARDNNARKLIAIVERSVLNRFKSTWQNYIREKLSVIESIGADSPHAILDCDGLKIYTPSEGKPFYSVDSGR